MSRRSVLHVAAIEYSARTLLAPQMHALVDRGYDVRVACAPDGDRFGLDLAPFDPIDITFPRNLRPAAMARSTAELVRVARRLRPDILHLHGPSISLTARMVPRPAFPSGMRIVRTVHGFLHQWDPPMSRRDRILDRLEWALSRNTDLLLFQSREDYEQARARGYREPLVYLGNGVQDWWFDVPPPALASPLRLIFVGRLIREKGVLVLVDALAKVPEVSLTIVGGEAKQERYGVAAELDDRIRALSLEDRVQRRGVLSQDDLPSVMAEHHAMVLPTFHHEGVPRSVIEALAAGRPVIATDMRGCRELVEDGRNGFLVPRHSVPELARAIERLAALDGRAFAAMGVASRVKAEQHRESQVIDRLLTAYEELGVEA